MPTAAAASVAVKTKGRDDMDTEMLKTAGTAVLFMAVTTASAIAVVAAVSWLRSRRSRRRVCGVGVCEDCCGCDVALRHDSVAAPAPASACNGGVDRTEVTSAN